MKLEVPFAPWQPVWMPSDTSITAVPVGYNVRGYLFIPESGGTGRVQYTQVQLYRHKENGGVVEIHTSPEKVYATLEECRAVIRERIEERIAGYENALAEAQEALQKAETD